MSEQAQAQPQVITLNAQNSVQILVQYIEVANKAGTFTLPEADLLKRVKDFCIQGAQDPELTPANARQLLIQGITKGQSKGVYSLEDASLLHKVCSYVSSNLNDAVSPVASSPVASTPSSNADLDELSAPVPLKPRTV
jgi:hypothetical protein